VKRRGFLNYLFLPEMRFFWLFFIFLVFALIAGFIYLSESWVFFDLAALLTLGVIIILMYSLRSARFNLAVRVEREQLSNIIVNLYDAVIAYDPDFRILIFNRAAGKIFNVVATDIIGEYFTPEKAKDRRFSFLCQVLFPSLAPLVVRRSEDVTGSQVADFSFEDPKYDLRVTTSKIIDSDGNLLGFVKIIRDRTRELAILRSKSEFIEIAAHQLRTPLTGMLWGWETLAKESLTDEQLEIIKSGLAATKIAVENVNDLLDVAKIEEGKFDFQFEEINLVLFLEELFEGFIDLAKQANVKIFFQKPKDKELKVFMDKHKLSIALSNLITNAIKYNVSNGQVIIEAEKLVDQPRVQISVKDTGIGIPAQDAERLFTKFYRAKNAVKAITEGIGLGLYIAKNIVKAHGGEIWVDSELNRGSTFYITLPTDERLIPSKSAPIIEEY